MIVDSHVHYSPPARPDDAPVPHANPIDRLSPEELLERAHAIGIDKIVQVNPSILGFDNGYSLATASEHPDEILGVVARFDAFGPGFEGRLRELAEHPSLLGVRISLTAPGRGVALSDGTLDPVFAAAAKLGVWIQLFAPFLVPETHRAIRRFPDLKLLVDHMGLRYYAGKDNHESFRQWPDLLALAEEPNVWIKVSYFPEAAKDLDAYPYPVAQGYFRRLFEHVGPKRLVWGSNFPPVRRACTYREALDFVRVECDFLSSADREAILGGTFIEYFSRR